MRRKFHANGFLLLHMDFVGGDFAVAVDGKDTESFSF